MSGCSFYGVGIHVVENQHAPTGTAQYVNNNLIILNVGATIGMAFNTAAGFTCANNQVEMEYPPLMSPELRFPVA